MLKIGIMGVAGSGKTTLVSELKKIFGIKFNIEILDDISNKSPFDDNNDTNFISQFYYFSTQINEENKRSINNPDILICDKTIFDRWIYWKKYLIKVGENKDLNDKDNILKTIFDYWINTYDLIFFIRVDKEIIKIRNEGNNLRDTDYDDFEDIENLFLKTVKKNNVLIAEIWNNKSVDETVYKLAEKISEKLDNKDEN
jgi:deoxyadenosine/deoxycytidine kinase